MTEIGKLRQEANINGSTLKDVQQGVLNVSNRLSSNENSGIQVLSGDGGLILIFSVICISMLLYYFYSVAEKQKKVSAMLADHIRNYGNPDLHRNLIASASYTDVEKEVYELLYR